MIFVLGLLGSAVLIYILNWLLLSSPSVSPVLEPEGRFIYRMQMWLRLIIVALAVLAVVIYFASHYEKVAPH